MIKLTHPHHGQPKFIEGQTYFAFLSMHFLSSRIHRRGIIHVFYFPEYLQQRGVECYYDNVRLVTSVHVVFVGVLPSQLTVVADEIKDYLPATTIIYVPTSGIPLRRLRQMLGSTSIVQPEFSWPAENQNKPWNHSINVNMALENKDVVEKTCPICDDISGK